MRAKNTHDKKLIQQRHTIISLKLCACQSELQNVMTCILGMHFYSSNYRVLSKYNRRDVSLHGQGRAIREIFVFTIEPTTTSKLPSHGI